MLREIQSVRQDKPGLRRRWYQDEFFDLYTWHAADGSLSGFQVCYDLPGRERAITWHRRHGFSHNKVDDGTGTLLDSISTQNSPKNGVVSLQHAFLPTLLSDLKLSVNRTPFTTQNVGPTTTQLAVTGFTTLHDNLNQIHF